MMISFSEFANLADFKPPVDGTALNLLILGVIGIVAVVFGWIMGSIFPNAAYR